MMPALDRCHQQLAQAVADIASGRPFKIPEAGRRLWCMFSDLHQTRGHDMGRQPLLYSEIYAYSRLMRVEIRPVDVAGLMKMDAAFLNAGAVTVGAAVAAIPPAAPLTSQAFDAVFP